MAKIDSGPASTLILTSALTVVGQFMPNLRDVRKADIATDPEMVGDIRMGEVATAATLLVLGAVTASLSQSSLPLIVALLLAGGLVVLWESALRANSPMEPKGIDDNAI